MYVAGETSSINFPTRGPAQATNAGWQDAFAAKFTASGTLVYSTYVGGINMDTADAITVDESGSASLAGNTNSASLLALAGVQGRPDRAV